LATSDSRPRTGTLKRPQKTSGASSTCDEAGEDSLNERKRAWEDLDRESEEVKRKIRSHMRHQPETLVLDNPLHA